MDKLLVTVNDLIQYRPIAKEIPQERVEVYIQEAQRHDLMPILGSALYYDFITEYDDSGDDMYTAYQNLLNGSVWTYNGFSKQHYGLKPIVVYYALARLVSNNQLNVTRYGITTKVNPQSEPASDLSIRNMITELKSVAVSYQNQTLEFLSENETIYPLYSQAIERPVNNMGLKFFSI